MTRPAVDPVAAEAAQWLVRLGSGEACERDLEDFAAWQAEDPNHARAAQQMTALVQQMQSLRPTARQARAALHAAKDAGPPRPRRSSTAARAGLALALVLALALPAILALRTWPPAWLLADLHTGTGEWQVRDLADGTRIQLRGDSAVNLRYDAARRTLELVQGEILVDVAKDAAHPFVVKTVHGSIRALGTRFAVERQAEATVLSMLESATEVRPAASKAPPLLVQAGQRVRFTAAGTAAPEPMDTRAFDKAWQHRQFVASDSPLPDVLDALARERPGHLHYDRKALEGIRVSAVLPLDDTDRALQLLVDNLPQLRVRMATRYFVMVDTQPVP